MLLLLVLTKGPEPREEEGGQEASLHRDGASWGTSSGHSPPELLQTPRLLPFQRAVSLLSQSQPSEKASFFPQRKFKSRPCIVVTSQGVYAMRRWQRSSNLGTHQHPRRLTTQPGQGCTLKSPRPVDCAS